MNTVLVTGANGFVGNHLVRELVANNVNVLGVAGSHGTTKVSHIKQYTTLDLTDSASVRTIDFRAIDGLIHLAGLAAVGPSFDDPMKYINANIGMETNLFEAAQAQGAKPRFLIVSSGALYDPKAPLPLTEESCVIPSSPYAVSKLGQEQMAHYYGLRGFEIIIARPFNHIGPGQGLGFIVPDLVKQAMDFKAGRVKEISAGNLNTKRDYTDVRDIARAYRLLLEAGKPGGIYNVCSGAAVSGYDLLSLILENAGVQPPISQDASRMRPSDNPVLYGSYEKLTQATGWKPEIPIETTIKAVTAPLWG